MTAVWGSPELEQRYGIHSADAVGKSLRDFRSSEQAEEKLTRVRHVFDTGEHILADEAVSFSGNDFWQNTSFCPVRDASGNITAVVGFIRDITERKWAEEALRKSEEQYQTLLENHVDGVCVVADGKVVYANRALLDLACCTEEEMLGRAPGEFAAPEDRQRAKDDIAALLLGEVKAEVYEYAFLRKDGTTVPIDVLSRSIQYRGQPALLCVLRDISQRKRAEEALRVSEERFDLAARGTDVGIWDWDLRTDTLYLSPRWKSMLGYADDEVTHCFSEWESRLHPEDRERAFATVQDYLEGRSSDYELEHRLRHKNGSYRWILARGAVVRDEQGNPYRMVGSHLEITRRRQAEQAVYESEERLRQLTEHIREVFWMTSPDYEEMIYVSPGFEEIWGRTCEDLYKRPRLWAEVIHEEDREFVFDALNQDAHTGQFDREFRIVRPDETIRWIHDRAFPVRNESGVVYRLAGIAEDITERKRAEQTIRERDAELAHVTRLATMGEMVAEIAHEINQPLYAICNFASACRHLLDRVDGKPSERLAEGFNEIDKAAARAGGIIRRLREYVRREKPQRQPVNVDEIVSVSLELLGFELQNHRVRVTLEKPPEVSTLEVSVDRVQIEQVLINLLYNACEAMDVMPAEDRRIAIRLIPSVDSVEIAVEDRGVGVSDAISPKMFDTFFTTKKDGLGMGLAISKRIISEYGGRLWSTSNPGGGATFHFTLPLTGNIDSDNSPVNQGEDVSQP